MPLPLPNLDTRQWADLVDEGRSLVPRYAPAWTDYNVHDPGIMLIELFAWLVERSMYRANRVPERHRRKFVALAGITPAPPEPARVVLGVTLTSGTGTLVLPAGVGFTAAAMPFRTRGDVTVTDAVLSAVQVSDGTLFLDRTRAWTDGLPFAVSPQLLLGFDRALPKNTPVTVWFRFAGAIAGERQRILAAAAEAMADCTTPAPSWPCAPAPAGSATPSTVALPPHHSARLVWEVFTASGWQAIGVDDETRSLTLDGIVRLTVPVDMMATAIGVVSTPYFYVRARLASGGYDATPMATALTPNGVDVEQASPAVTTFAIASGVTPTGALIVGQRTGLSMTLDATGVIQALDTAPSNPAVLVVAYTPATAAAMGSVSLALAWVGTGTGVPDEVLTLGDAPIARGAVDLWTLEGTAWRPWNTRADMDAARPTDASVALDVTLATATTGDGVRGRVMPNGAPALAAFAWTVADQGNIAANQSWQLDVSAMNRALLGADPATIAPLLTAITNRAPAARGAAAEALADAADRAAAALWSHERLVDLTTTGTLDQVDRATVLGLTIPNRATTTLDFERIALDVPGTRVRRARAWANIDPRYPCLDAVGTVTVIIVPELPAGRPQPTAGLIAAVRRYLDPRRVLCTRLVVTGPTYVDVSVTATVQATPSADPSRVQADVIAALDTFFDPIVGGPDGRGWPFGRDIYRSEVMATIDGVPGVDHVLTLTLGGVGCGNICVGATSLVVTGTLSIVVSR